jgi:hypothetical protein
LALERTQDIARIALDIVIISRIDEASAFKVEAPHHILQPG